MESAGPKMIDHRMTERKESRARKEGEETHTREEGRQLELAREWGHALTHGYTWRNPTWEQLVRGTGPWSGLRR